MQKTLSLILGLLIVFTNPVLSQQKTANISKNKPTANSLPNIFRPIGDLFKKILRITPKPIICPAPEIGSLNLSKSELIKTCSSSEKDCIDSTQMIQVESVVVTPDADVLNYRYTVSGGKIVGKGQKVIWDLSEVKVGFYTITAGVDTICEFCGRKIIKTVVVK